MENNDISALATGLILFTSTTILNVIVQKRDRESERKERQKEK